MAVVIVDALHRYRIIAAKTFHSPGTDEVLPTSSGVHHVQGSRGEPSWSFKVNQSSVEGESKLVELGDDSAHFAIKTAVATHQQRGMANSFFPVGTGTSRQQQLSPTGRISFDGNVISKE